MPRAGWSDLAVRLCHSYSTVGKLVWFDDGGRQSREPAPITSITVCPAGALVLGGLGFPRSATTTKTQHDPSSLYLGDHRTLPNSGRRTTGPVARRPRRRALVPLGSTCSQAGHPHCAWQRPTTFTLQQRLLSPAAERLHQTRMQTTRPSSGLNYRD